MLWFIKFATKRSHILVAMFLGIMLSSLFVTSSLLNADVTVYSMIYKEIDRVKVDSIYDAYLEVDPYVFNASKVKAFLSDVYSNILGFNSVKAVDIHMFFEADLNPYMYPWINITCDGKTVSITNMTLDFLAPYSYSIAKNISYFPSEIKSDEIYIEAPLFAKLGFNNVSEVNITFPFAPIYGNATYYNLTFSRINVISELSDDLKMYVSGRYYYTYSYGGSVSIGYYELGVKEAWLILSVDKMLELLSNTAFMIIRILVRYDRDALINPWSLDESVRKINILDGQIENVINALLSEHKLKGDAHLSMPMLQYTVQFLSFNLMFMKTSFMLYSLPIFLMAWFLALIINWIFINEKRKLLGLLKVRGASDRTIRSGMLIEASLIGIGAGVVGGVLGIFVSEYLLIYATGITVSADIIRRAISVVGQSYLILAVILGMILSILSSWQPAKKASSLKIIDALYEHVEEIEVERINVRKYVALMLVGVYGLFEALSGYFVMIHLISFIVSGKLYILALFFFVFIFFELFAIFIGPLLLAYSSLRLMIHYAHKLTRLFKAITFAFIGDLSTMVAKNFARKPARTARIGFLIILMIGTAMAFNISAATSLNVQKVNLYYSIGADLKVLATIPYSSIHNVTSNITGIEGVSGVAGYTYFGSMIIGESWATIYAVNSSYFGVSYISNNALIGATVSEVREKLESRDKINVVISKGAADLLDLDIGQQYDVYIADYNITLKVNVIAITKFIPGILSMLEAQEGAYILLPMWVIDNLIKEDKSYASYFSVRGFFVKVEDGYNSTVIAEKIENNLKDMNIRASITVYDAAVKELLEGPGGISYHFTTFMFIFSSIITLMGVALVMAMNALERRREIALLKVRGFSNKQIMLIFLSEALIIALLAVVIGFPIAIGYASQSLPQRYSITFTGSIVVYDLPPEITIVIPITSLIFFAITIVGMMVLAVIPAFFVSRRNIASEIRIVR